MYFSKSSEGVSIDSAVLNPIGQFLYLIYSIMGYYNPYIARTGKVSISDVIYCIIVVHLSTI